MFVFILIVASPPLERVKFKGEKPSKEQILKDWAEFGNDVKAELDLPSSPDQFIYQKQFSFFMKNKDGIRFEKLIEKYEEMLETDLGLSFYQDADPFSKN